jgi:hypothetical protein
MRLLLLMLGISVCVVGIGTRAEAQNYPWCAYYSGGRHGGGGEGVVAVIFSVGPRMASPSWHSPRTWRMRAKEIMADHRSDGGKS